MVVGLNIVPYEVKHLGRIFQAIRVPICAFFLTHIISMGISFTFKILKELYFAERNSGIHKKTLSIIYSKKSHRPT